MNSGFNFAEIDRLEKAWPRIKDQYIGKARPEREAAARHLSSVGISPREAVGQHAPEDMLAGNVAVFSAQMQHEMGWFERGRVFGHLGLPQALGSYAESARSGEADVLADSCDEAAQNGMEHYAHYYKGLVFEAMQNEDEALELFKAAYAYENLGSRPAVKLIGKLYARHKLDEGRHYLNDALKRGLLSDGLLRHLAKYLNLRGAPSTAISDYVQVCIRNGKSLR